MTTSYPRAVMVSTAIALAVLTAVVLALVTPPKPAEAAFPGVNGKIAFARYHFGDNLSLFTVSPKGLNEQLVPVTGHDTWQPAISPDGKQIAFTHYDGLDSIQVAVANADGSGQRTLTPYEGNNRNPAWSPDGQQLVYQSANDRALHVVDADGTDERRLTGQAGQVDLDPDWSPDGTKIAFVREYYTNGIYEVALCTVSPSGADEQCSLRNGNEKSSPDFSPDGLKIVYSDKNKDGNTRVRIWRLADGTSRTLVAGGSTMSPDGSVSAAVFSPSGDKVAFEMNEPGFEVGIYTINLNGTGKTRVTSGYAPDWGPRPTVTSP